MSTLAERLPGRKATVLDTACCGMAGAFGALAEKYDLSLQVAQRLLDQIDNQPHGTEVIASGTSCRHQISDLTNLRQNTWPSFSQRLSCSGSRTGCKVPTAFAALTRMQPKHSVGG